MGAKSNNCQLPATAASINRLPFIACCMKAVGF